MKAIYTRDVFGDGTKISVLSGTAMKSAGFDDPNSVEYRTYIFWPDSDRRVAYYAHESRVELVSTSAIS